MPSHNFFRKLGILLIASCCLTTYAQDPLYVTTGTAYNPDSNQVIYREAYTALSEQGEVQVHYLTPEGKKFATKTLWYQGEPFQPTFEFRDLRNNETLSAKFENARLILRRQDQGGPMGTTLFDHANIVIDTGYDAYIQLNWDKLLKGKALKFDYAMPSRLKSIKLEVEKIDSKASPVYDREIGAGWVYFKLSTAKKWTAFFSEPVYLAYDPNGKYLMRFYGRSNILDARGIPQDVRIEYEYF